MVAPLAPHATILVVTNVDEVFGTDRRRSSSNVDQTAADLLAYVRNNPGQRGEDIAETMGTDSNAIRLPMKKLIADGKVRTKGERRGMRYFAA